MENLQKRKIKVYKTTPFIENVADTNNLEVENISFLEFVNSEYLPNIRQVIFAFKKKPKLLKLSIILSNLMPICLNIAIIYHNIEGFCLDFILILFYIVTTITMRCFSLAIPWYSLYHNGISSFICLIIIFLIDYLYLKDEYFESSINIILFLTVFYSLLTFLNWVCYKKKENRFIFLIIILFLVLMFVSFFFYEFNSTSLMILLCLTFNLINNIFCYQQLDTNLNYSDLILSILMLILFERRELLYNIVYMP